MPIPLARAKHNASISPQFNPSINPKVNASINPKFNPWINPERNSHKSQIQSILEPPPYRFP